MITMRSIRRPLEQFVEMKDMQPLQVAIIAIKGHALDGHYVLRTCSKTTLEIMDLSQSSANLYWTGEPNLRVRLLGRGEKITIDLSND